MTNIQAIVLLKSLEQSLDDYCELNDEGKTAFRMAITALEVFGNSKQLPFSQPEPCEEAQHILDYLDNVLHPLISPEYWNVYSELYDMIAALPSAQPESCEGCIQYGLWENEIEYGYPSPCTGCKRRVDDNYER